MDRVLFSGDLPTELYSYIVKKQRTRNYTEDPVEQCPRCGAAMVLRTGRTTGALFYGCPSFPGCRGYKPFEKQASENNF